MSRYRAIEVGGEELRALLRAVDRHLTRAADIVIIGGGAAALGYGAVSTTSDLDTFTAVGEELRVAFAMAIAETGFDVEVSPAFGIAELPYHYDTRLERPLPELVKLTVAVPERHDLVLSKVVRYVDHDRQQVVEIHAASPLSLDVLVGRYVAEMTHVLGPPGRLRTNLLEMIEDLFGELRRRATERRI